MDSTFYGLGKTNYMLIQPICIDSLYYVTIHCYWKDLNDYI